MMEPFDWKNYLYEQQRRMNASGGLPPEEPPVQRTPLDEIPETPPAMPEPVSQAQQTAKTVLGIGTTGPMAERQNQAVDDYAAQRAKYFETTGQHEPQQFGRIEGTFLAESPLKPKEAIESMMATKTPQELERYANMRATRSNVVTPQQQLAKNQAYEEKAQQDRLRRDQERDRLRTQGYANREAARDKDMDMWSQFRTINGVGGGGYGGGPQVQQMGGAVFVGPGFGHPVGYGRGYGGYGRGMSPEQLDLHERELQARINNNNANQEIARGRNQNAATSNDIKKQGQADAMDRFKTVNGQKVERSFDEKRKIFEQLMAEYDRRSRAQLAAGQAGLDKNEAADMGPPERDPNNPAKTIQGVPYPGSFNAIKRRIYTLGRDLAQQHDGASRNFAIDDATMERWNQIKAWIDSDRMAVPQP